MKTPKQILLVEDEIMIAMDLEYQLEQVGYQVIKHVTSGEKAIEVSHQQTPDVDVVSGATYTSRGIIDATKEALNFK